MTKLKFGEERTCFLGFVTTVKLINMKTRKEEEREHIKYCQEKIKTLPKKYHPFWERQIKKSNKFLYGG